MTQFFKKFPVINYANNNGLNLLARVNMSKLALNNKQAYYSYVMPAGERPDNLSHNYYDNPDYVWLIGLTNQIIDPYYDYPLSDENLNTYISNTYGSIPQASQKILFFRTNWVSDNSVISVAAYGALGTGQQKYWAPQIGYAGKIQSYVRKQETWQVTTNLVQILNLTYDLVLLTQDNYTITDPFGNELIWPESNPSSTTFQVGELITQYSNVVATVVAVNSNFIVVEHIAGTSTTITTDEIDGVTSGASGTVLSIVTTAQNIPDNEMQYWEAVNAYDYEVELNANKKQINLLDNRYSGQATKQLKDLLAS